MTPMVVIPVTPNSKDNAMLRTWEEQSIVVGAPILQVGIPSNFNLITMSKDKWEEFRRVHFPALLARAMELGAVDDTLYAYLDIEPLGWKTVLYKSIWWMNELRSKFVARMQWCLHKAQMLYPKLKWTIWGLPRTPGKGLYPAWMSKGNSRLRILGLFYGFDWYAIPLYQRYKVVVPGSPLLALPPYITPSQLVDRVLSSVEETDKLRRQDQIDKLKPIIPFFYCRYQRGFPWLWPWKRLEWTDVQIIIGALASTDIVHSFAWWHQYNVLERDTVEWIPEFVLRMKAWMKTKNKSIIQ